MCREISSVCDHNNLPLSVEVFSLDPEDVYKDAINLVKNVSENLSVKVPIEMKYLPVITKLSSEGVKINATCGYTANQLTAAARCGARYVSLFYRRAIDSGEDVKSHLEITRRFIEYNELDCEIIAGSIRKPDDIVSSWANGAHIATASPAIIELGLQHEGTSKSINGFMKDFSEWMKK
jgi:transaldolase